MLGGKVEYRQAFRDISFEPRCELLGHRFVFRHHQAQQPIGLGAIGSIKHGPQIGAGLGLRHVWRQMREEVLGQVKLAALPLHTRQPRLQSRPQAGVIVAGHQLHAVQAARLQTRQELAPMDFRLRKRHARSQNRAMSVRRDAQGDQQRTRHHGPAHADFFIARVQEQVGDFSQRTLAPLAQLVVQRFHRATDLHAGNFAAAELLHHGGHLPRRDALQIHLGDRQLQRAFAARAAFQGRGIKCHAARLGHGQFQAPHARVHRLGLEPVGVTAALVGALIWLGAKHLAALQLHCFVQKHLHCLSHSCEAMLGQELQDLRKATE